LKYFYNFIFYFRTKDATYNPDDGFVKMYIRGRPVQVNKIQKIKIEIIFAKTLNRLKNRTVSIQYNACYIDAHKKDGRRYPIDSIANCYYRFFSYMTPYLICQKKPQVPSSTVHLQYGIFKSCGFTDMIGYTK
jgi:hypothetical protein